MDKNLKILRFFSYSYWCRRSYLLTKWKDRKKSIKHIFIKGKTIKETIQPDTRLSFNETFNRKVNSASEKQRIINSLDDIH